MSIKNIVAKGVAWGVPGNIRFLSVEPDVTTKTLECSGQVRSSNDGWYETKIVIDVDLGIMVGAKSKCNCPGAGRCYHTVALATRVKDILVRHAMRELVQQGS